MAAFVNILFDESTTRGIAHLQQRLSDAGISDYAQWLNYPPHLTLVRLDGVEPEDLIPAARQLLPLLAAKSIELSGLAIFPGAEPVLWLAPAPSVSLLQAHRRLCSDLAPMVVHDHYRPGLWVPHVTLAARLDQKAVAAAVSELVPAVGPTSGKVAALEVVSFPPARVVWREPVADQQEIAFGDGHQALASPCQ